MSHSRIRLWRGRTDRSLMFGVTVEEACTAGLSNSLRSGRDDKSNWGKCCYELLLEGVVRSSVRFPISRQKKARYSAPAFCGLVGVGVRVIVAVVVVLVCLNRWSAAVSCYFAVVALELDGGMVDAEFLPQGSIHLLQNRAAFGGRNVGDDDVRGQRVSLGS